MISDRKKECRNHNFNKTDNTPYQGVEQTNNISLGVTEGFTGMLGKTAANDANAREAEILKNHKTAFDRALSDYAAAKKVLDEQTAGFVNSVKGATPASSDDRSGSKAGDQTQLRVVKWADNKLSVITDRGIVKPMTEDTWNKIKGKNGCPANYEVNNSESLGNPKQGQMLGTTPNYYVGSDMKVQSCHKNSGINARVMGAADPMQAGSTYVQSYSRNDGMGSSFETQEDLTQSYDSAINNDTKLDLCASRAVDLGRTGYGVWRDGNNVKCAVAPANTEWSKITSDNEWRGVPQLSKVLGASDGNSMSLLYDGRLVKSNIPNKKDIMYQGINFNNYTEISNKKMETPTDATVAPRIIIENATYGGNCNGQENKAATDAKVAAWQMRQASKKKDGCTIM